MRLSIIDIGWPGDVPTVVPLIAAAGYHRFWTTEHYSAVQSASPTILAAVVASLTPDSGLRVGTAGVLLNFRSPASVAADFKLLEVLFPGRIDLGVAAATGVGDPLRGELLDGRDRPTRNTYAAKVEQLADLLRRRDADDDLGPQTDRRPDIWVCGTTAESAELAGRLGLCFAFHDQLAGPDADGPAALARYRAAFVPHEPQATPRCTVAVYGLCAASERRALRILDGARVAYAGRPAQCAEQLAALAERYRTDELATYALTGSGRDRLQSYLLVADELGLARQT